MLKYPAILDTIFKMFGRINLIILSWESTQKKNSLLINHLIFIIFQINLNHLFFTLWAISLIINLFKWINIINFIQRMNSRQFWLKHTPTK